MKDVYMADYSLKLLAKERQTPLLFREKTAVAAALVRCGLSALELPAVKKSREDGIICRTIASAVGNTRLCLELGPEDEDVSLAWSCLEPAQNPCLQLALPVSAARMEYVLGLKEAPFLEKLACRLEAAAARCRTEFIAEDAGRADQSFLLTACRKAEEAGASAVCLCDDDGSLLPQEWTQLVGKVCDAVRIPVYVKVSEAFGLGMACALAALEAGAAGVKCAFCGETALHTDVLAKVLAARGEDLGLACELKSTELKSSTEDLLKQLGHHDYLSTGSTDSTLVEGDIFLDGASGPADVAAAVRSLGYDLSEEDNGRVFEALMKICRQKSSVGRRELEAIVSSAAMQVPSTYHLNNYSIASSNVTLSMAQVTLIRGEEQLAGMATGDGPIDAAFRALEQAIGSHYELDDFQIQAVTEGKESLGSTLVKLRSGGKLYSGTGLSTDIVGASIRAYINALNKIAYEEQS